MNTFYLDSTPPAQPSVFAKLFFKPRSDTVITLTANEKVIAPADMVTELRTLLQEPESVVHVGRAFYIRLRKHMQEYSNSVGSPEGSIFGQFTVFGKPVVVDLPPTKAEWATCGTRSIILASQNALGYWSMYGPPDDNRVFKNVELKLPPKPVPLADALLVKKRRAVLRPEAGHG